LGNAGKLAESEKRDYPITRYRTDSPSFSPMDHNENGNARSPWLAMENWEN